MIWRSFLHSRVSWLYYSYFSKSRQIQLCKLHFISDYNKYTSALMAPRKAAATEKVAKNGTQTEEKPKRTTRKAVKEVVTKEKVAPIDIEEVAKPIRKGKVVKVLEENNAKPKQNKKKTAAKKAAKELEADVELIENGEKPKTTAPKRNAATKEKKTEEAEEGSKKKIAKKAPVKKDAKAKKKNDVEEEIEATTEEPAEKKKTRKRNASPVAEIEEPTEKKGKGVKAPLKNATVTDWDAIDFTTNKLNSKNQAFNFHITSWNVDGIRAWLKKGGLDILLHDKPDIFCIQETKCSTDKLPDEVKNLDGYKTYWCSSDKEGYAGVGILSKPMPIEVHYGIGAEEHDDEGRCITAEYKLFYLVNVYVPNAGRKLVTLPKRLEWNKMFKEFIKKLNAKKPVIVCGDFNVAHTEIDLANPKTNTKNAGFTPEEREGFTEFLGDGYVDSFRKLYPDEKNAYTFWTYMLNARGKNVGWRLDYFVVSDNLMDRICDNVIYSKVLGSDHCPISLYFHV